MSPPHVPATVEGVHFINILFSLLKPMRKYYYRQFVCKESSPQPQAVPKGNVSVHHIVLFWTNPTSL